MTINWSTKQEIGYPAGIDVKKCIPLLVVRPKGFDGHLKRRKRLVLWPFKIPTLEECRLWSEVEEEGLLQCALLLLV